MAADRGRLVVVAGPSGVGKGTLLGLLAQRYPETFRVSVSVTTRSPRPGEVDGREYFFWTREAFAQGIREGAFLEWAEYAGNLYGTPRHNVEAWIAAGYVVILEIEVQGARQVAQSFPAARRIFIAPPAMDVLEARLRQRGNESEAAIQARLQQAKAELEAMAEFDCAIVNDNLDAALAQLEAAVFDEKV